MEDSQSNSILKELSDIKASLAVNTSETQNIKNNISEIKTDLKEIKNDFVSRRELKESIDLIQEQLKPLKRLVYGATSLTLVTVVSAILYSVIKK